MNNIDNNIEPVSLESQRLADFKKVLTYHLVTKIKYHFKGNVEAFYKAPRIWKLFRARKLSREINPFGIIAKFNNAGLSRKQVQSIFGKYIGQQKFVKYAELIASDSEIEVRRHGTLLISQRKETDKGKGFNNVYLLPKEYIAGIFADAELLKKVCDAGSEFYSDRQRRLIFTQIANKKKNYHYKTNKQIAEEEEIKKMVDEFSFDDIDL